MSVHRILVANRPSNVASSYVSRSISARLLEPLHYLRDAGTADFLVDFPSELRKIYTPDWIFFNKAIDNDSLEYALEAKMQGARILYDVDDHVLAYPAYSGAKPTQANIDVILKFLSLSDIVSVANPRLLKIYKPLCSNIQLLPNGIYTERYASTSPVAREDSKLRIGMVNADFLKIVNFKQEWLQAIDAVRDRYPDIEFMYYGDFPPDELGLQDWHWLGSVDFETYRRSLFTGIFDIGLVPLGGKEDEGSYEFNLCKNPFKFIEFGAAGIAGVYSRVPIYETVIDDGVHGRLVENQRDAWIKAIATFVDNPDGRRKLVENAALRVEDELHIKYAASALALMLR